MDLDDWLLMVPRPLRELPIDLLLVGIVVVVTDWAIIGDLELGGTMRTWLGAVFVLFLPGYAITSALFPSGSSKRGSNGGLAHITGIERVVISIGLSIAVVPIIGLVLNFSPWEIRLMSVVLALSVLTLVTTGIAVVRRNALPLDDRFSLPIYQWVSVAVQTVYQSPRRLDRIVTLALALLMLTAVLGVVFAIASPPGQNAYSELAILSRDATGVVTADEYPGTVAPGERVDLVIYIGNRETRSITYSVVVALQQLRSDGLLEDGQEVDRFRVRLNDSENRIINRSIRLQREGVDQRLTVLLYKGPPPDQPSRDTAYRAVHLWIDVIEPTPTPTETPSPTPQQTSSPTPVPTSPTPIISTTPNGSNVTSTETAIQTPGNQTDTVNVTEVPSTTPSNTSAWSAPE